MHSNVADKKRNRHISALRPAWARYGVAIVSVALGCLAREALTPGIGPTTLPFIFFFPALAIAAWFGGLGPGLLAIVLSALAANCFFSTPVHVLSIKSRYDLLALVAFVFASLLIVSAVQAMHLARRQFAAEIA